MSPLRKARPDDGPEDRPDASPGPGEPDGRPLDAVLAELTGDDPELRRRAVLLLADRPGALPALIARVGVEPDRTVLEALCTQLARHDRPEVVDGLVRHLASDDAGLRTVVVDVLARTPTATARRIPQLMADPDPDVRILTVMMLGQLRLAEVEGWLAELVRTDPHPNVVSAAIGELALLAGERSEADLDAARARFPADPFIAFAVTRALAAADRGRP